MKATKLDLPINTMAYLENGYTLFLKSIYDYCIVKLIDNKVIDLQTNTEINLAKHPFEQAYILLEQPPSNIISKDRIETLFHLASIKK